MKKQPRKCTIYVRGAMLLLWMGIIFLFSSLPGSGSSYDPPLWYILERKGAHILEFALLTIFAFRFFRIWFGSRESWRSIMVISAMFVFMWAALDELHQAFVFGRSSRLFDIGIDVFGSMLALGVIWSIFSFQSIRKFRKML